MVIICNILRHTQCLTQCLIQYLSVRQTLTSTQLSVSLWHSLTVEIQWQTRILQQWPFSDSHQSRSVTEVFLANPPVQGYYRKRTRYVGGIQWSLFKVNLVLGVISVDVCPAGHLWNNVCGDIFCKDPFSDRLAKFFGNQKSAFRISDIIAFD